MHARAAARLATLFCTSVTIGIVQAISPTSSAPRPPWPQTSRRLPESQSHPTAATTARCPERISRRNCLCRKSLLVHAARRSPPRRGGWPRPKPRRSTTLGERERRGAKILKLDDHVTAAVEKLKAKGLTSPYLKAFVVARVNYTRFSKAESFDFDETLDKIIASTEKFNVDRVKQDDVARAGGPPDEE